MFAFVEFFDPNALILHMHKPSKIGSFADDTMRSICSFLESKTQQESRVERYPKGGFFPIWISCTEARFKKSLKRFGHLSLDRRIYIRDIAFDSKAS